MHWKLTFNWLSGLLKKQKTIKVGARVCTPWGTGVITGGSINVKTDKEVGINRKGDPIYPGYTVNLSSLKENDLL